MDINNLKTIINNTFKGYNIFFGENIGEYKDNYKINYQIPNQFLEELQRTYRIEFDVFSKDSIVVENIAAMIEGTLNYQSFSINEQWAHFNLDGRYNDKSHSEFRVTIVYYVRTY